MAKHRRRRRTKFWCPVHQRQFLGRQWCGHRRHCKAALGEKAAAPPPTPSQDGDRIIKNLRSNMAMYEEDIAKELNKILEAKVHIMEANAKIDDLKKAKSSLIRSLSKLIR